jgi:hypothetical protein
MSSWGYTDNVTIKGTVAITTSTNTVTGTSTEFTSNVRAGDYLTISGQKYQIHTVLSNTSIYLTSVGSTTATGQSAYLQQGPKFISELAEIANVYGAVFEEMNTQALSSIAVGTAGNYAAAAKSNTTVTIATSGASQPTVNATATINYTSANVTSFTITNPGAGYSAAAQQNTTVTIATTGATQPTQNATGNLVFTSGTSTSNASHQGWVSYTSYTDGQGQVREKSEVLVAMSKNFNAAAAGDDENVVFPN